MPLIFLGYYLCWSVEQEYAPIGGEADFCKESAKLAFGDTSPVVTNNLNVTIQVEYTYAALKSRSRYFLIGAGAGVKVWLQVR